MGVIHRGPPMLDEIAACVLGGLGQALFSERFAANPDRSIVLHDEPVVRYGAPTAIQLDTRVPLGGDRVAATMAKELVDLFGLDRITPEPSRWEAAAAYLVVLFVIRLIGRRTASQQAPITVVVLFMFGRMSVSAVKGDDRSLKGARSALFTVGLMHVAGSWLKILFVWLGRDIDGTPMVVFRVGRWNEPAMRRLRVQQAEVRTATRQQGLDDLDAATVAVVERAGKI